MAVFESNKGVAYPGWRDWRQSHPPKHWSDGRSAPLLAQAWGVSADLPWRVRMALEDHQRGAVGAPLAGLQNLRLTRGVVEYPMTVPGAGRASMTDLAAWTTNGTQAVFFGVEGKVSEPFGSSSKAEPGRSEAVREWLQSGKGKGSHQNRSARILGIAHGLGLTDDQPLLDTPYQLCHRTYAALEAAAAQPMLCDHAVMLVHSFLPAWDIRLNHLTDFVRFAEALLPPGSEAGPDRPLYVGPRTASTGRDVHLWLCWVSDAGGRV